MAAGKTHAVHASGMREAGIAEEGETQKVSNCFYLLSSFSSGWIQVSLSPLATAILVFEGTTSKGGTETLCKR